MGVPVITLRGETSVGRGGVSLLSNLGMTDLVANHSTEFIEIAKAQASNLDRLATIRRELRQRMLASPLCDEAGFARDVEAAYRRIWEEACARA
jgi:predicted O-linked N-acetylglucosamine transferase (SPINDLY family)